MSAPKGLVTVGVLLGLLMVSTNIPSPLYRLYAAHFHFGPAVLTAIFATYVVFLIPSLLFWGQWSDQRGRRHVLGEGLVLAILGTLSFLIADSTLWLFVARAFQGLAAGMLSGSATAMLGELDPSRRKAPLIAALATGGGTAIGPLVGGVMAQYAPWPLHLVYGIALVGLVSAGLALTHLPETRARTDTLFHWRRPRVPKAMQPLFWLAGGTAFVVWSVTAFFMSLAPSYVGNLLHVTNLAVAGGVVFLMLATASVTQILTRGGAPQHTMPVGLSMTVVAVVGLLLAAAHHSVGLLMGSTVFAGVGQGLAFLGSLTTITQSAPEAVKADVVSSFYVVIYVGVGAPVIGIGLVAQRLGLLHGMVAYTVFIGCLTIGILGGFLRHWHRMSQRINPKTLL